FGGYFSVRPAGAIRRGDNDTAHRYGGEILARGVGAIAEMQRNLIAASGEPRAGGRHGRVVEHGREMNNLLRPYSVSVDMAVVERKGKVGGEILEAGLAVECD